MVLKLYSTLTGTSPPARTVALVLIEKQVPFEIIEIDISKGEHKTPESLEKSPFAQVPYIDDDGFIVYESRAICRYIATKYADQGTKLIPTDLKGYTLFEQAASVEQNHFHPPTLGAIIENLSKKYRGLVPDKAVFDEHIKTLNEKLDVYDKILAKQKYLTGNEITLADLFHLPYGSMLAVAGSNIMEEKPNVARWFKDLASRPSWLSLPDGIKSIV